MRLKTTKKTKNQLTTKESSAVHACISLTFGCVEWAYRKHRTESALTALDFAVAYPPENDPSVSTCHLTVAFP